MLRKLEKGETENSERLSFLMILLFLCRIERNYVSDRKINL